MTKKNAAGRKSRTHFEQIPLEAVKKIANGENGEDSSKRKAGAGKVRAPKVRR